jgi:hypothetical protein
MPKVTYQIPISHKQAERSVTTPIPAAIVDPMRRRKKRIVDTTPKTFAVPKHKDAARPRDESIMSRSTYVLGDGDTIPPRRSGSLDFLKWPSVGNSC